MMLAKIVIIEDEAVAAQRLCRLLAEIVPQSEVIAILQGVEDSVEWFQHHPTPDIVFADIHIADGLAFHIFKTINVDFPLVFTTAYDQYALQAFQVNGIDYLLKPISKEALTHTMAKIEKLRTGGATPALPPDRMNTIIEWMQQQNKSYKSHFLIPWKDRLIPLSVNDIAYFYVEAGSTHAVTFDQRSLLMGEPLELIMKQLDPKMFFRANRQYIVAHRAIEDIIVWFGSKLRLNLTVPTPEQIVVSKANVPDFKTWFAK